jgi:hypothetical protein
MDQRHADYVAYYEARARRHADQPLYPRTAAAERRLADAIRGCARLDDFRAVIETERPEQQCAIARVLDQAAARAAHFRAMEEPVRARGHEQILATAGQARDVAELTSRVNDLLRQNSLEVTVDGFVAMFHGDWKVLEDLEVDAAILDQVPAEWRAELAAGIADAERRGRELYANHTRVEHRKWAPGWDLDHAQVWEPRHRRLIPEPDEIVARRIEQHRRYLGIA